MREFLAPFGRVPFWPAVGVVAAAAAIWGLARLSGVDLLLWQLVLLGLASLAAGSIVSALRTDAEPAPELFTRTVNAPTWRPFVEVNRWEDQLIFAETKPGRFESGSVKRQLVELVDERLRLRRGLSMEADPEQCRELLGERTYAFLTRPVADCPTPWQLDEYLTKIEEI
ncbi:hypothetical protein L0U85_10300 [Glycomyces sp. L485]|uniref:hypothetical protein n=1 Tax=Glycomyces sp. L485 TaxID=2909235 RepID=UPI001F4ADDE7|nr:hypothetical protein [Glycomyces sp. L485]MCH7231239.1 hypothetical protein [Glycomyces sp. L485]